MSWTDARVRGVMVLLVIIVLVLLFDRSDFNTALTGLLRLSEVAFFGIGTLWLIKHY